MRSATLLSCALRVGWLLPFLCSLTPAAASAEPTAPALVAGLLGNCVEAGSAVADWPTRVCYPGNEYRPPDVLKLVRERGSRPVPDGIPSFLKAAASVVESALDFGRELIATCEADFAARLLDGTLRRQGIDLSWAEAIVLSPAVESATIYMNTDPRALDGGFLAVLPQRHWCFDQQLTLEDLRRLADRWMSMERAWDQDLDRTALITRALDDLETVYRVLETQQAPCVGVEAVARWSFPAPKPRPSPRPSVAAAEPPVVGAQAGPRPIDGSLYEYLRDALPEGSLEFLDHLLDKLGPSGISISLKGLTTSDGTTMEWAEIKQGYPDFDDYYDQEPLDPEAMAAFSDDFAAAHREIAEALGVEEEDLQIALLAHVQVGEGYLNAYRERNPLADNEIYVFDANGKVTTAELAEGCRVGATNNSRTCGQVF